MAALFTRLKGNRNMTVILAIATIAVWTSVALRVTEPSRSPKTHDGKISNVNNENFRDSIVFTLSLDYKDPFHLTNGLKPKAVRTHPSKVSGKAIVPGSIEVSDIFYLGSVSNGSGKRKALVRHRSKYYYADVNDTIGTFLVRRVYADSMTLVSGNRVFKAVRRKDS